MKQRILVAVVGVPALLAVLCAAPDWATLALLMGLCIIASHELLAAVLPPEKTRRWWGLAATLAVFVVANVYFSHERFAGTAAAELMPWLLAALVVVLFLCMVLEYGKKEEMDFTALCAILVAGAAIPLALSCLLRLRLLNYGGGLVLMPLVAAFMSDSAALFTGMACGKHKLAPIVSPKKTVEGAVGGVVCNIVFLCLYTLLLNKCFGFTQVNYFYAAIYGVLGAVASIVGDLTLSVVKRQGGIKDYGNLIPGHGGILDRFDSTMLVAPLTELLILLIPFAVK